MLKNYNTGPISYLLIKKYFLRLKTFSIKKQIALRNKNFKNFDEILNEKFL